MITKFDSIILEYFKDKRLCGATATKFLSMHKEIDFYLEKFLLSHPEYIKKSFVINYVVRNIDLSSMKCKTCGKQQDYYHKESVYCSHKCMISNPDYQKKRLVKYINEISLHFVYTCYLLNNKNNFNKKVII